MMVNNSVHLNTGSEPKTYYFQISCTRLRSSNQYLVLISIVSLQPHYYVCNGSIKDPIITSICIIIFRSVDAIAQPEAYQFINAISQKTKHSSRAFILLKLGHLWRSDVRVKWRTRGEAAIKRLYLFCVL